jgi:uncharacterized protein
MATDNQINVSGFKGYEGKKDGLYYFRYENDSGKPLLFSQPYHSARSRDQGMESLLKNAKDARRFFDVEEGGRFFFAIKAANHQEIARSRPFKTAAERDEAKEGLRATWSGAPKEASQPLVAALARDELTDSLPYHRFSLSFYPKSSGSGWRGKIEYPLDKGDKDSFEGIDLECIGRFIQERLPQTGKVEKKATLPPKAAGIPFTRPLEVIEAGEPYKGREVTRDKKLELRLPLSAEENQALQGKSFSANLWIKPMNKSADSIEVHRIGAAPADKAISIEAPIYNLDAGLYRFTLQVEPEDATQDPESAILEGSSLLLVS